MNEIKANFTNKRNMRKKLLFISHSGELGGAESKMLAISKNTKYESEILLFDDGNLRQTIENSGLYVDVMPMPTSFSQLKKGSKNITFNIGLVSFINFIFRLRKKCKSYDAIICMSQKAHLLVLLSAVERKKILWFMNDRLSRDYFGWLAFNFIKVSSLLTNYPIILNSKTSKEHWLASKARKKGIHTIYSGVDITPFHEKNIDTSSVLKLRSEFVQGEEKLLVMVGRICDWKGQHLAIEAIKDIKNVHLVIVGGAQFDGDREYKEFLNNKVLENSLNSRVSFTGHVENVSEYLLASDVVLHCSTIPEPFGRVIVEGMLAKKIVLAPNVGGPQEILQENQTGYFFESGSTKSLKKMILKIISLDSSKISKISLNARDFALNNYSSALMIEKFEQIISSM